MPFSPIEEVLADLRAGKMIVLADDERRENEGDLVLAAQFVTPEALGFMLSVARGYLCLALTEHDCDRLELTPQVPMNTSARGTAFTVSIDAHPRHGLTTGVSARERAMTIRLAIDPARGPGDFVRPGHINPLRARAGGVLVRTGHTEGSVDLCRLAGLTPAAAIIEVLRPDGEMARLPELAQLCREHGLKMCSVEQIIAHRLRRETLVRRLEPVDGTPVQTPAGEFRLVAFDSLVDPLPHVALTLGAFAPGGDGASGAGSVDEPTLVRMHRRSFLGDILGCPRAGEGLSSGALLHASLRQIRRAGRGAVVYMRPEGREDAGGGGADGLDERLFRVRRAGAGVSGVELGSAGGGPGGGGGSAGGAGGAGGAAGAGSRGVAAYDPERDELDLTHPQAAGGLPPAMREFGIGGQILRHLGVTRLRLLTNHTQALPGLEAFGLQIVERVRIEG